MNRIYFILFALIILLAACGAQKTGDTGGVKSEEVTNTEEPISLTMGTKMPENNVESEGVREFVRLVDEKTDGQLQIDVYYHEQLGNESQQIGNVISGTQDIYFESMTYYIPYVKDFNIHSLPFLFADNEEYQEFLKSDIQEKLEQELIDVAGIRFINTEKNFVRGPYRTLVSKEPVKSQEDLKGMKLRLAESETALKAWSALGANPTVIPWSETYLALQQGVVDAVTSPISLIQNMNFHEVAKNVTITYEYPQSLVFAMNEEKFQSLTPELQESLVDAANEAGEIGTGYINDEADEIISFLEGEGVEIHEVDLSPWQEKMSTVYDELIEEGFLNGELINSIMDWKSNQ